MERSARPRVVAVVAAKAAVAVAVAAVLVVVAVDVSSLAGSDRWWKQ